MSHKKSHKKKTTGIRLSRSHTPPVRDTRGSGRGRGAPSIQGRGGGRGRGNALPKGSPAVQEPAQLAAPGIIPGAAASSSNNNVMLTPLNAKRTPSCAAPLCNLAERYFNGNPPCACPARTTVVWPHNTKCTRACAHATAYGANATHALTPALQIGEHVCACAPADARCPNAVAGAHRNLNQRARPPTHTERINRAHAQLTYSTHAAP